MLRNILLAVLILGFIPNMTAQNSDINLLRKFNGPVNSNPDAFMRGVTNSVVPLMIAIPTGLLIYHRSTTGSWTERHQPYVIGVSLVATVGVTYGLKKIINRPRPFVAYTDIYQKDSHVGPYSFPSGHTSSAFALATSLSLCYTKWYVVGPAFVWAISVGVSRMYLGVHYPTDVLVGALIGSGCAVLTYHLNKKLLSTP